MAMSLAASAISAFCASLKPVVPITACTPSSRHTARCASVPSGRVKSISTCASCRPARRSDTMGTPLAKPRNAAASLPIAALPATSSAPARRQSWRLAHGLDQHVAHAAGSAGDRRCGAERRGEEESVTRFSLDGERRDAGAGRRALSARIRAAGSSAAAAAAASLGRLRLGLRPLGRVELLQLVFGRLQRRHLAAALAGVERGDEFFLARHRVAFEAVEQFAVEEQRQTALLRLDALAPDREHVVPAVGMEHVGQQRGAEDFAHLLARHAGLERLDLFLGHEIALDHLDLVGRDGSQRAAGAVADAAAGAEAQARGDGAGEQPEAALWNGRHGRKG